MAGDLLPGGPAGLRLLPALQFGLHLLDLEPDLPDVERGGLQLVPRPVIRLAQFGVEQLLRNVPAVLQREFTPDQDLEIGIVRVGY
jgi:hypothetical protein